MRDRQHGAVSERLPDGFLHEVVGLAVDGGRRLVEHDDLAVPQDGARHADELPFADAEVLAVLDDFRLELVRQRADLLARAENCYSVLAETPRNCYGASQLEKRCYI